MHSVDIPTFVEKVDFDWSFIKASDEPDIVYKRFHEMNTKFYNNCFPLKKTTRKQRCFKKPWLTKALLKSIKIKNKLYQNYLQVSTVDGVSLYKRYKNKLYHTLRLAKRRYYEKNWKMQNQIDVQPGKLFNKVLNRKKPRSLFNSTFKSDNQEISVLVEVANRFTSLVLVRTSQRKYLLPPSSSHKDFIYE